MIDTTYLIQIQLSLWGVIGYSLVLLFLVSLPVLLGFGIGYRRATTFWQQILSRLPWGVAVFDRRKQRIFQNDPAGLLLKQISPDMLEPVHRTSAESSYSAMLKGQEGALIDVQAWAVDPKQGGSMVFLRNITQEHEKQQRMVANYQRLIRTLGHEISTPLSIMQLQLSNIASNHQDGLDRQHALQVTLDETERLKGLVSNLMELSRLESGQPLQRRLAKINGVAEEAMSQLIDRANARQIMLSMDVEPDLPRVKIDLDTWKQVFLNLIDNAIKYGKQGGAIKVEMRKKGEELQIAVVDDGPGMTDEDLSYLFNELFRGSTSRAAKGSGLGLAIVRRIVEQHGGQIRCASQLGKGTTFYITLPLGS